LAYRKVLHSIEGQLPYAWCFLITDTWFHRFFLLISEFGKGSRWIRPTPLLLTFLWWHDCSEGRHTVLSESGHRPDGFWWYARTQNYF
jgi:hypothetical protein